MTRSAPDPAIIDKRKLSADALSKSRDYEKRRLSTSTVTPSPSPWSEIPILDVLRRTDTRVAVQVEGVRLMSRLNGGMVVEMLIWRVSTTPSLCPRDMEVTVAVCQGM